ncbi:hypothetical protein SAMN02799636_04316 [Methylobacterium sp. 275MFSha3.1]|uniref:hypothetical protein n=1 Tax=Methylobacterium sp. 275MFSha3.1 TaxID=1502746 RepID=UPI0008A721C7|nr:hypothetical protein [Methylobacterium sp. 275MFSha3.1]SEH89201.1 hypothetical protein SAMN02799636_04316 [Methylobacterium sp. 275MFSha3.1]
MYENLGIIIGAIDFAVAIYITNLLITGFRKGIDHLMVAVSDLSKTPRDNWFALAVQAMRNANMAERS